MNLNYAIVSKPSFVILIFFKYKINIVFESQACWSVASKHSELICNVDTSSAHGLKPSQFFPSQTQNKDLLCSHQKHHGLYACARTALRDRSRALDWYRHSQAISASQNCWFYGLLLALVDPASCLALWYCFLPAFLHASLTIFSFPDSCPLSPPIVWFAGVCFYNGYTTWFPVKGFCQHLERLDLSSSTATTFCSTCACHPTPLFNIDPACQPYTLTFSFSFEKKTGQLFDLVNLLL